MEVKLLNPDNPPYAMFRFNGEVICMTEYQVKQAQADAKICRCGSCLACRTVEYLRDANN